MTTILTTLILELEDENGNPLTKTQKRAAIELVEHAIRHRLFGNGFLPDTFHVETWEVTSS